MSALARTAPPIGDWRTLSRGLLSHGCSSAFASICARRSGEAPSRNQDRLSALMATCAWLRALPGKLPTRTPRQFGQAQFHWGNPPPAAEPRTLTRILEV